MLLGEIGDRDVVLVVADTPGSAHPRARDIVYEKGSRRFRPA